MVGVPSSSAQVRGLVVEAVDAAAALMVDGRVVAAWDQPSALDGMTVGALSAHLVRAAGAVLAYLDRTAPDAPVEGEVLTPVTYFHAAIASPIHDRIKEVSAIESWVGPGEIAARCGRIAEAMRTRFTAEPEDRLVGALGGRMLSLDDFCRTRLIEVLVHLDDLAASVGLPPPATDPAGRAIVIDILVDIARMLHGDWEVIRALSRAERHTHPVFPVL